MEGHAVVFSVAGLTQRWREMNKTSIRIDSDQIQIEQGMNIGAQ